MKSLGVPISPFREVHETGVKDKAERPERTQGCAGNTSAETGRTEDKSGEAQLDSPVSRRDTQDGVILRFGQAKMGTH